MMFPRREFRMLFGLENLMEAHGFKGDVRENPPPAWEVLASSLFLGSRVPLLLSAGPDAHDVIFTSFQEVHHPQGPQWLLKGKTVGIPHYEAEDVRLFVLRKHGGASSESLVSFAQRITGQTTPVRIIQ